MWPSSFNFSSIFTFLAELEVGVTDPGTWRRHFDKENLELNWNSWGRQDWKLCQLCDTWLTWSQWRDASSESGRGPVLDPGHHGAPQIPGGGIQVRHCGHIRWVVTTTCTLGTSGSLLTFTAPANVIVTVIRVYFHCEKPSKQGLFGESIAKLFLYSMHILVPTFILSLSRYWWTNLQKLWV